MNKQYLAHFLTVTHGYCKTSECQKLYSHQEEPYIWSNIYYGVLFCSCMLPSILPSSKLCMHGLHLESISTYMCNMFHLCDRQLQHLVGIIAVLYILCLYLSWLDYDQHFVWAGCHVPGSYKSLDQRCFIVLGIGRFTFDTNLWLLRSGCTEPFFVITTSYLAY